MRTRPQDLLESPENHVGETVVVSGEIERTFSSRTFTVGGDDFARDLLVISMNSIATVSGRTDAIPVAENDIVQVTGVVRRLDAAFRQEHEGILPKWAATEFQGEPVIVALQRAAAMHEIQVSPRLPGGEYGVANDLSVATDTSTQEGLEGRVAALPRAPVQEVVQQRMFWIGSAPAHRVLVVVNAESSPAMEGPKAGKPAVGDDWIIHSVFRELPPEAPFAPDGASGRRSFPPSRSTTSTCMHFVRLRPKDDTVI